jgi:hypothetical protein
LESEGVEMERLEMERYEMEEGGLNGFDLGFSLT